VALGAGVIGLVRAGVAAGRFAGRAGDRGDGFRVTHAKRLAGVCGEAAQQHEKGDEEDAHVSKDSR
jgi:hypothetical protein